MNTKAQFHLAGSSPQLTPSNPPVMGNNFGKRTVYTPTNSSHLNSIFDSIASQIQQLDHNVKWKLELTIIDDSHPHNTPELHRNKNPTNSLLLSSPSQHQAGSSSSPPPPPLLHQKNHSKDKDTLAITSRTQYPWDFVVPISNETWSKPFTDEIQQQLKDAHDRQKYLQDIIHNQAEQIGRSTYLGNDAELAIATMRSIFLMLGNEQKLCYTAEIKLQHKEITMLERKLERLANILQTVENIKSTTNDTNMEKEDLLQERQQLLRKLHLAELRLSARDAEMEYIIQQQQQQQHHHHSSLKHYSNNIIGDRSSASPDSSKAARRSPTPQFGRKGPPYLFQQQYSPKMRSSIRPSTTNRHHQKLSGLESLGILADQMLSDPDFEHNKASPTITSSPLKQSTTLPLSHQQQQQLQNRSYQTQSSPNLQKHNSTSTIATTTPSSKFPPPSSLGLSHQRYTDQHSTYRPSEPFDDVPWATSTNKIDDAYLARQPKRSKRSIDSATALLSIPMLSSSFHPIAENPEQEHDTIKRRARIYNISAWTPDEDDQLRHSVSFYGSVRNWGKIANIFRGRSAQQCQQRWELLNPTPEPIGRVNARQSPSIAALLDNTNDMSSSSSSSSLPSSPLASANYRHHANNVGDRPFPPSSLYQSHSHTP